MNFNLADGIGVELMEL